MCRGDLTKYAGRLPAPLHDTPDARINYGSSLLGKITPYAYGQPGYLSSQVSYLNIPHKIQKIVPPIHLPEARQGAEDTFSVSHPVDDADIAFTLRLNRNSIFCTGLKAKSSQRMGYSGIVDPLVNLCTVNYILSGVQLGIDPGQNDKWRELLHNMDASRFGRERDYNDEPINLSDIVALVRDCIRPLGIVRGSERQGGQNEATLSPATWPVCFITSVTLDGKESNVLNVWHYHKIAAGDDLVLRLKLMPVQQYTLNHYDKGVVRKNWGQMDRLVWQLVPGIFDLERSTLTDHPEEWPDNPRHPITIKKHGMIWEPLQVDFPWQALGYWHIGRSQISSPAYGNSEYWNNDLANILKTNHLDVTLQPTFMCAPHRHTYAPYRFHSMVGKRAGREGDEDFPDKKARRFMLDEVVEPDLSRRQIRAAELRHAQAQAAQPPAAAALARTVQAATASSLARPAQPPAPAPVVVSDPLAEVDAQDPEPAPPSPTYEAPPPAVADEGIHLPSLDPVSAAAKKQPRKKRVIEGSLLKADGTSEASPATMLG